MIKKAQEFLNQPFVLWFFSSVVIGLITWQYTEAQKNSVEVKAETRILKKFNIEVNLLLQDIRLGAESNEGLTVGLLSATLTKMQYNGINPSSQSYFPTLQNVMLEIDSRTNSRGLEKFQKPIYKHITTITKIGYRVFTPTSYPNEKIWERLDASEKKSMRELAALTQEIQKHYQAEADK